MDDPRPRPEPAAAAPAGLPGRDAVVLSRLEVACSTLDLAPPPLPLRLMVLRGRDRWTLLVHGTNRRTRQVLRWLKAYAPSQKRVFPQARRELLWFEFECVPARLEAFLNEFRVHDVLLRPDGVASLLVEGPNAKVRSLLSPEVERNARFVVRNRPEALPRLPLLTSRQHDALAMAAAAGYYDVPRRVSLRTLAKNVGVSTATLSELLRRAEAHIILAYVSFVRGAGDGESDSALWQLGTAPGRGRPPTNAGGA